MKVSRKSHSIYLVVAGEGPVSECDGRRGLEVAGRHSWPLGVEEDLEVVRSRRHVDGDDGDTRVRLVSLPSGECRVGRQANRLSSASTLR